MSILINKETKILVQGLTGKTGTFHTEQALSYFDTQMVGGTHQRKVAPIGHHQMGKNYLYLRVLLKVKPQQALQLQ